MVYLPVNILGTSNSVINVEARAIDASAVTRKCIVSRLADFTIDRYKDLEAQNAAGLLIILPKDLNSYSPEQRAVIKLEHYYNTSINY